MLVMTLLVGNNVRCARRICDRHQPDDVCGCEFVSSAIRNIPWVPSLWLIAHSWACTLQVHRLWLARQLLW